MVIQGRFRSVETLVFERLDKVLLSETLPNGTSLAAALASALEVDVRLSGGGDAFAAVNALSSDQIVDLASDLRHALANELSSFELPMGSICTPAELGGVNIGKEVWVSDAGVAGLHPLQLVRRDAHGSNLLALRAEITRRVAGKPWARIGLPFPVFIVDSDARHLLQFPAFTSAGGVVLQRWANETGAIRFCAATPTQIEEFAASIVDDMKLLWRRRRQVAADVRVIRSRAQRLLAESGDAGSAVNAIAVQLSWQRDFDDYDYYVQFDGIDHAMRPGLVLDFVPSAERRENISRRLPAGVRGWLDQLQELLREGADGHVDEVTASLLRIAPEGAVAILARLARDYETTVTFTTDSGPLHALLYWRYGSIESEICVPGRFEWAGHTLEISSQELLSDVQLKTMIGSRVQDAFDLPVDIACIIRRARQADNGTVCLDVDVDMRLVNTRQGRVF